MTAAGYDRGHLVYYDEAIEAWRFMDTNELLEERPCILCHRMSTKEGYDPCLGHIPEAISVCCGHGEDEGYILFEDGSRVDLPVLGYVILPDGAKEDLHYF